jgi:hypothetical protein
VQIAAAGLTHGDFIRFITVKASDKMDSLKTHNQTVFNFK